VRKGGLIMGPPSASLLMRAFISMEITPLNVYYVSRLISKNPKFTFSFLSSFPPFSLSLSLFLSFSTVTIKYATKRARLVRVESPIAAYHALPIWLTIPMKRFATPPVILVFSLMKRTAYAKVFSGFCRVLVILE